MVPMERNAMISTVWYVHGEPPSFHCRKQQSLDFERPFVKSVATKIECEEYDDCQDRLVFALSAI